MKTIKNCNLSEYTSFKAGGSCKRLVIPESELELSELLSEVSRAGENHILLGNGSNTLFADGIYDGTVIKLVEGFNKISASGCVLKAGSATLLSKVAREAMNLGLGGLEAISGIPGSIGGALFMNAGAYGGEMSHVVKRAYVMKFDGGKPYWISKDEMELGYRTSRFKHSQEIILAVEFQLEEKPKLDIKALMDEYTERRNSKQPLNLPSCGSFFKRPEGYFAGSLIQDSGLAGYSIGGAQVSEKHCGFLVNKGGATATDVIELKNFVQKTVKEKFGVDLEPEVRIII